MESQEPIQPYLDENGHACYQYSVRWSDGSVGYMPVGFTPHDTETESLMQSCMKKQLEPFLNNEKVT